MRKNTKHNFVWEYVFFVKAIPLDMFFDHDSNFVFFSWLFVAIAKTDIQNLILELQMNLFQFRILVRFHGQQVATKLQINNQTKIN